MSTRRTGDNILVKRIFVKKKKENKSVLQPGIAIVFFATFMSLNN